MEIYTKDHAPLRQGKIPKVTSEENGCKHLGINDKSDEIRHFKIDGGVIRGTKVSRCDYLLANDTARRAYYIELKGSDVRKAMAQIDSTVAMVRDLQGYTVFPRVIFRGTVNITNSERTRWSRKYQGRDKIKRGLIEESICHDE